LKETLKRVIGIEYELGQQRNMLLQISSMLQQSTDQSSTMTFKVIGNDIEYDDFVLSLEDRQAQLSFVSFLNLNLLLISHYPTYLSFL
jgi:hypothetical protein